MKKSFSEEEIINSKNYWNLLNKIKKHNNFFSENNEFLISWKIIPINYINTRKMVIWNDENIDKFEENFVNKIDLVKKKEFAYKKFLIKNNLLYKFYEESNRDNNFYILIRNDYLLRKYLLNLKSKRNIFFLTICISIFLLVFLTTFFTFIWQVWLPISLISLLLPILLYNAKIFFLKR